MNRIPLLLAYLITCLVLTLQTSNSTAQTASIQSIVIIPSQPTINDQISAIITTSFSSGSCEQVVQYVTVLGNLINVQAGHNLGPLAYICTSIDTVDIGFLSAGNYTFNYNVNASGATATDSVLFTVINPTNVPDLFVNRIKFYPNPANKHLTINSDLLEKLLHLSVIDLSGNEILMQDVNVYFPEKKEILVDIADISNGIYFLQLSFENKRIFKKLVIQH